MKKLLTVAVLVLVGCKDSPSGPPPELIVRDTILWVGESIEARAVAQTIDGDEWPRDRRLDIVFDGAPVGGLEIRSGPEIAALAPASAVLKVTARGGATRTLRVGVLQDLRGKSWTFTSRCRSVGLDGRVDERSTRFVASSSSYHAGTWNGLPTWFFENPRAGLLLTGVQTDTFRLTRPGSTTTETVVSRTVTNAITQDHTGNVRYTEVVNTPGEGVERIMTLSRQSGPFAFEGPPAACGDLQSGSAAPRLVGVN